MPTRRFRTHILLLVLLGLAGCDETERDVVTDIGITRIYLVDPGVQAQSVTAPDTTIQVAKWAILGAELDLGGAAPVDLTLGESCSIDDTVDILPFAKGLCESGVIVDSNETPIPATLNLVVTMQVRRAEPEALPAGGDFDGDHVPNAVDNCPLLPNSDQQDSSGNGIGDACTTFVLGIPVADNDGDGVADFTDNCVWRHNPAQEDTIGLTSKGTPDGIGDACTDELADVVVGGDRRIELTRTVDFTQPLRGFSFVTADFDTLSTNLVSSCDWVAGECEIDPDQIEICVLDTEIGASLGC